MFNRPASAVFLDKDGTLIEDAGILLTLNRFIFLMVQLKHC